jgi:hypothetical protein
VFSARLSERLGDFARGRGAELAAEPVYGSCTYPGDDDGLRAVREQFAAIDRSEHPENPGLGAT